LTCILMATPDQALIAQGNTLYVTGDFSTGHGVQFRQTDGSQGIGFGGHTIYANGSNADQELVFAAKGPNGALQFATNGYERVRITGSGNVGINIGNPHAPLQFANLAENRKIVLYENGNNDHEFFGLGINGDGSMRFQTPGSGNDFVFYNGINSTSSNEIFRIKGSGMMGLGVAAPMNKLDINAGDARTGTHPVNLAAYITGNLAAAGSGLEIRQSNGNQGIGLGYNTIYAAGNNTSQDLNFTAKGANGNFSVSTNGSERMKINGNGFTGFNVASPLSTLDVSFGPRTGVHGANNALYVTGWGEFRTANAELGLGILGNQISATGSLANVDLSLAAKGASGNIILTTNTTEKMRITSAGKVGIGTNLPNAPLQFSNTSENRKLVLYEGVNNDHQFIGLGHNTTSLRYQVNATTSDHIFYAGTNPTNSSELMRIKGTGNVGIGTTAPNEKLEIAGDGRAFFGDGAGPNRKGLLIDGVEPSGARLEAFDYFTNTGIDLLLNPLGGNVGIGTSNSNAPLQFSNTSENRKIVLSETANNNHQFIGLGQNTTSLRYQVDATTSNHIFYAGTSTSASAELMRIEGTGEVGIGIAAPANKLDIASAARTGTHNTGQALYVTGGGEFRSADATLGIGIASNAISATGSGTDVDLSLAAKGASGNLSLSTNGTERLKITGLGNFGFGVTAPANKLDVHNGIARTGTHGNGMALYVTGGGEFRSADATQGLGILSNSISATGTNTNVDLAFSGKGATGNIIFNTNAAEKVRITGPGYVGIGTTLPNAPLQFASIPANRKIVLFEGSNNDHQFIGFGVDGTGALRYQTANSVNDHIFYTAASSSSSTELMRITGTCMMGIGNSAPHAPLQFPII
jgi:hypothetical protein